MRPTLHISPASAGVTKPQAARRKLEQGGSVAASAEDGVVQGWDKCRGPGLTERCVCVLTRLSVATAAATTGDALP